MKPVLFVLTFLSLVSLARPALAKVERGVYAGSGIGSCGMARDSAQVRAKKACAVLKKRLRASVNGICESVLMVNGVSETQAYVLYECEGENEDSVSVQATQTLNADKEAYILAQNEAENRCLKQGELVRQFGKVGCKYQGRFTQTATCEIIYECTNSQAGKDDGDKSAKRLQ